MAKKRAEVDPKDCWNVEAFYPSFDEWEKELSTLMVEGGKPLFFQIGRYQGRLQESSGLLLDLLKEYFRWNRLLTKLYTYAHLRHDEDITQERAMGAFKKISALYYQYQQVVSWVEPEILQLPEDVLEKYLQSESLKEYKIYLERLVRQKPHTLPSEQERLLALGAESMQTAERSFSAFHNADLRFLPIVDSEGKEYELTEGTYQLYLKHPDRKLRENGFKTLHDGFGGFENTLCELINGQVQSHLFFMRARKFSTCVEAALFPYQIEPKVYETLIQTARSRISSLNRYLRLRKKMLGLDELQLYDLYVPLIKEEIDSIDYKEAVDHVLESMEPLGAEYQKDLKEGLVENRWVDCYENEGKRSGGYSSGCYDSMPYILLNYHGTYSDLSTLSHEAGHSMHSLLSKRHQPYHYSHYPIFVAEVASTFHEELLVFHLLSKAKTKERKAYLLTQRIEAIRTTFFRQVLFAEFELAIHKWAEEGIPLTPALLKEHYRKLYKDYYGQEVVIDRRIDYEWARIPHFYYNFYVYQYATGISAAHALVEKVKKDPDAIKGYLQFLSSGCSDYPLNLLKTAGVDMTTSAPIHALLDQFESLIEELENL